MLDVRWNKFMHLHPCYFGKLDYFWVINGSYYSKNTGLHWKSEISEYSKFWVSDQKLTEKFFYEIWIAWRTMKSRKKQNVIFNN